MTRSKVFFSSVKSSRLCSSTKPNLKIIKQDTYIDDGFLSSKETEYFWWFCHSVVPRGKQIRPGIMRINNVGAKKIKLEIRQAATSVGKRKWRLKSRLVKWAGSKTYYIRYILLRIVDVVVIKILFFAYYYYITAPLICKVRRQKSWNDNPFYSIISAVWTIS